MAEWTDEQLASRTRMLEQNLRIMKSEVCGCLLLSLSSFSFLQIALLGKAHGA